MSSPLQQKALKKVHFLDFIIYPSPDIAILVKREVKATVRSSMTAQFLGALPDLLCSLSVKPQHSEHHKVFAIHAQEAELFDPDSDTVFSLTWKSDTIEDIFVVESQRVESNSLAVAVRTLAGHSSAAALQGQFFEILLSSFCCSNRAELLTLNEMKKDGKHYVGIDHVVLQARFQRSRPIPFTASEYLHAPVLRLNPDHYYRGMRNTPIIDAYIYEIVHNNHNPSFVRLFFIQATVSFMKDNSSTKPESMALVRKIIASLEKQYSLEVKVHFVLAVPDDVMPKWKLLAEVETLCNQANIYWLCVRT